MENATKALLIAAGVLVVILLIAFGMSIFRSVDSTTGDADVVADALKEQTGTAKNNAYHAITGKEWTEPSGGEVPDPE